MIGVGNALRGDDAAGVEVARRLRARLQEAREGEARGGEVSEFEEARKDRAGAAAPEIEVRELEGETLALLDVWEGADAVVLVDAVRSGAAPGMIHRVDASRKPLPARLRGSSSTHAVGVGEAIELARSLGRLPRRVVLYGLEGAGFDAGAGLSRAVAAAVAPLAEAVLGEARALGSESSAAATAAWP